MTFDPETFYEVVITFPDGSTVTRLPGTYSDCEACGRPKSFWHYQFHAPDGLITLEGTYCTILCRDRAARRREQPITLLAPPPENADQ